MVSKLLLSLSLLCLTSTLATAATAEDFFHNGAQQYIFDELAKAKEITQRGLSLFPNDPKLKRLEELLKEEEQQQQNEQNQKDQKEDQSQQEQDQQKQNQPQPDQQQEQPSEQSKDEHQQQQQAQQEKQDQQQQQQQNAEKKDASQGQENPDDQKDGQAAQAALARMTLQDALQLLDTTKDDENLMPFHLQLRTNRNDRVLKNW